MQSWNGAPPAGYALVPDTLDTSVFYNFMGFVTLELDGSTVTAMTVNQEALDAYKASLPEPVEPPPTTEERVAALLCYSGLWAGTLLPSCGTRECGRL